MAVFSKVCVVLPTGNPGASILCIRSSISTSAIGFKNGLRRACYFLVVVLVVLFCVCVVYAGLGMLTSTRSIAPQSPINFRKTLTRSLGASRGAKNRSAFCLLWLLLLHSHVYVASSTIDCVANVSVRVGFHPVRVPPVCDLGRCVLPYPGLLVAYFWAYCQA